jgi:hypothetical protein
MMARVHRYVFTHYPELEARFLNEYAGRIIVTASNVQDVLIQCGQLINDRDQ